ncbi:glucosaminidase domain-containing protein [Sulfurimonas sp.]|uniref:glucosaminidase domain-containing protein n=1 Tax=Sulfurimonas sp. TaxID=2022749 RepID=UPI002B498939|nr:glucosaminidase domain-containing protein [Sulfurimonas sp.]
MNFKILTIVCLLTTMLNASDFSFRKYSHVEQFYAYNANDAIEISIKYNLPPAAILAMAGLESGYGSGYVAQITGNILSLGAFKKDKELPSLYLPYSKSKKMVIFDSKEIKKYLKDDLAWKQREKSLKRDYRPSKYAGTVNNLELLTYDEGLRKKATIACLNDFATRWITDNSNIKVFKETRLWLDKLVKEKGVSILFSKKTNQDFILRIGGHSHSFNYRKTWPKKVKLIMKKVGLVELTSDIYFKSMDFNTAWKNR